MEKILFKNRHTVLNKSLETEQILKNHKNISLNFKDILDKYFQKK